MQNIFETGQQAFANGYDMAGKMRQDRSRVMAGRSLEQGDLTGAANALGDAGNIEQQTKLIDAKREQDLADTKRKADTLLKVAQGLKTVPQGQRHAALQSAMPVFQQLGIDPGAFANLTEDQLTDPSLDQFTTSLGQAVKLHFIQQGSNTVAVDEGTGQVKNTYRGPMTVKDGETIYAPDSPAVGASAGAGVPPPPAPPDENGPPIQTARPNVDAVWSAMKQRESGGNGNAVSPQGALGSTQMLPATAQAMAQKVGVAWRPDLIRGTSPEALSYQDKLGRAYFEEGLQRYGGDPYKAASYYHGGPNEAQWGPKTRAYAAAVTGGAGGQSEPMQGGSGQDTVQAPAGYHVLARGGQKQDKAPSGYRWDAKGNLQPIPGGPADPGGLGTGTNSNLTGEAFLSSLPKQQAAQVKAIADGRMAFPAGFALKSPYWQQMLTAVSQYDPNFDAVNYNARSKTRADFTSGKNAQNIKALNTAIGHLGRLSSQISGTAGLGGFPGATLVNHGINIYERSSGDPGVTNFEQTASALATELTAVFRGTGGAEADVKRYLAQLDSNASDAQKKAAVKNIAELLRSRLEAVGDQYSNGMGKTTDPLTLLNPVAAKTFQTLESGGGATVAPQRSTPQRSAVIQYDAHGNRR